MSSGSPQGAGSAPTVDPGGTPAGGPLGWLRGFGALRLMLVGSVVLLIAVAPFSGGRVDFEGVALLTTLVAPVAYAVFVFVLPLDMMMTFIFMNDAQGVCRARLKRVLVTEAVLFVLLMSRSLTKGLTFGAVKG